MPDIKDILDPMTTSLGRVGVEHPTSEEPFSLVSTAVGTRRNSLEIGEVSVPDPVGPEDMAEKTLPITTTSSTSTKAEDHIFNTKNEPISSTPTPNASTIAEMPDLEKYNTYAGMKPSEDGSTMIIDWSNDDPENPLNWPSSKKIINVTCISLMALLSPLTSSMFTPALPNIESEFGVGTSTASLAVTTFVIGFGIGPLIWAPLSEVFGRRWVYIVTYSAFTVFQVGCALSPNIAAFIITRFFAGFFGASGISNGGGTISDMYAANVRSKVIGWYVLGPLLGPCIGPIAGGFIAENLDWRWIFWILLITAGCNTAFAVIFLKESYHPTLLARKAARIQEELGRPCRSKMADERPLLLRLRIAIVRPLKILFMQPIVFMLACYMALIYGTLYLLFTSFPAVFQGIYGMSIGISGLAYLGCGVGFQIAILFGVPQIQKIYNQKTEANGGVGKPEFRLPMARYGAVLIPVGLFIYGWTVQYHVHYIVPILATVPFGTGMILIFNTTNNYFIDSFTRYSASAISAGAVFRAIVGAVFPLFAPAMYEGLGYGWGTSVLGFAAVGLVGAPWAIMRWGEEIRERYPIKLD